ncbi:MAG: MGMT family protein [Chlamydiae bacterium]|nr:MGMT family protein [Chlamydiota bacterium]
MQSNSFTSGPHIKVTILSKESSLHKVLLSHSDHFSCEIPHDLAEKIAKEVYSWLLAYSLRKETKILHFDLNTYPPFTKRVLEEMALIPLGSFESYSGLAKRSGSQRAARAVGNICRGNPFPLFIPCHRVLSADGSIGGFAYGLKMKQEILQFENAI